MSAEETYRPVPEFKASITCHVSSIVRETFRATVEDAIKCFEHVIEVNGLHIE